MLSGLWLTRLCGIRRDCSTREGKRKERWDVRVLGLFCRETYLL